MAYFALVSFLILYTTNAQSNQTIDCQSDTDCVIDCSTQSCAGIHIHGDNATRLNILCRDANTCTGTTVHCPFNYNYTYDNNTNIPQCLLTCTGENSCTELTLNTHGSYSTKLICGNETGLDLLIQNHVCNNINIDGSFNEITIEPDNNQKQTTTIICTNQNDELLSVCNNINIYNIGNNYYSYKMDIYLELNCKDNSLKEHITSCNNFNIISGNLTRFNMIGNGGINNTLIDLQYSIELREVDMQILSPYGVLHNSILLANETQELLLFAEEGSIIRNFSMFGKALIDFNVTIGNNALLDSFNGEGKYNIHCFGGIIQNSIFDSLQIDLRTAPQETFVETDKNCIWKNNEFDAFANGYGKFYFGGYASGKILGQESLGISVICNSEDIDNACDDLYIYGMTDETVDDKETLIECYNYGCKNLNIFVDIIDDLTIIANDRCECVNNTLCLDVWEINCGFEPASEIYTGKSILNGTHCTNIDINGNNTNIINCCGNIVSDTKLLTCYSDDNPDKKDNNLALKIIGGIAFVLGIALLIFVCIRIRKNTIKENYQEL